MPRFARSSVTTRPASRHTIRTQLLIGLVAVAVVPLLTFAGVAGARLLQSVDRDATTVLVAEATTVVDRMDDYVERHRRGIVVLAADSSQVSGRALGIRLAIDDFGTGYSLLSYLQRLPIDVLKIDKSFIDTVDDNARGAALVRTILRLAETMSLRCVAEGIETESQLHALREMGCAYGQGFLFARPASSDEVGERLLRRSASLAGA